MPSGWERINARKSQPNKNIVFIKPLPGPDFNTSKDFLERIAAQCLPIMNKHHLAVTSLEEYEPNLEFWGRNFNNGEVIQLVLKSPSTGRWLPMNFVQLVMMHELAHNKQMNHSKAFWAVRNEFSAEMKALWDKGYTGDGLWGRGVLLENGAFSREALDIGEVMPEHMCGGTFKSRGGRKRKAKPKITYKERQQRRIIRKFGVNGVALGADDEVKVKLEKGKRPSGKPRVAGSARGRELRAAAALARFEVKKEEPQMSDQDLVTNSEAGSDYDDTEIKAEPDAALDINGLPLLDHKGGGMVRVCGDEDNDDVDVKRELLDLQSISRHTQLLSLTKTQPSLDTQQRSVGTPQSPSSESTSPTNIQSLSAQLSRVASSKIGAIPGRSETLKSIKPHVGRLSVTPCESNGQVVAGDVAAEGVIGCLACSAVNEPTALTCMVCLNVLRPEFMPNHWRCASLICSGGKYLNSGDVSLCGVCGARKSS